MPALTAPKQALTNLTSSFTSLLCGAGKFVKRHPILSISAAVASALFPLAVRDYRSYLTLGRGGYRYSVAGWFVSIILRPFGRDTISVEEYEKDEDKSAWLKAGSGPGEIPERGRPRPTTGRHFIPHRQVEAYPDKKIQELLTKEFQTIASSNPDLVIIGRSPHENFGDGLLVHSKVPSPHGVAEASWREIGHIHTTKDHSLHVTLAPADCKLVIEQGWGERHPLAGAVALPKEYLMVYAPLTEDDVRVVGLILRASVGYMTGSKDVH